MAVRDHTGRIRPSIPLDGTLTSSFGALRHAGRAGRGRACRRTPTVSIGHAPIPLFRRQA